MPALMPALTPAQRDLAKAWRDFEREKLVAALYAQLQAIGLGPLWEREYRFDLARKWRLDLYAADFRLGIECHGGTFSGGRHTRPLGFMNDREKMNAAVEAGIRVLEYPAQFIRDGTASRQIERIICADRCKMR